VAEIRLAQHADVPAIVAMGRAMHAESPTYRDKSFDPDKVAGLALALIGGDAPGVLLVAQARGELAGLFAGVAVQRWFGHDWVATDIAVYVKPEHRGGSAFARLVRAFEAWAAARGVSDVSIGVTTGVHVDRTVHAYQRLGYTLAGPSPLSKTLAHVHRT
jgi:GNAT superfamily N-acetyltransferase